jgi:FAD/FMN-containing dehydrogenase
MLQGQVCLARGLAMQIDNFGLNIQLAPLAAYSPESEAEVLEILNRHQGRKFRCVGRLHSWSQVLEADDLLLDLRKLDSVRVGEDGEEKYVDVGAGCQIKRLLYELQSQKSWTLPSVGFITEQTIAGAISTGTHGSGRHSLSHYVLSIRIARYDSASGQAIVQEITAGDELLAARCSLGCLGVILSVRMQCRAAYSIEEHFREYEKIESVLEAETAYPIQQFYLVPWNWTYVAQHRRESLAETSKFLRVFQGYRFLIFDLSMNGLIVLTARVLRSDLLVRILFRWVLPNFVIRNWRVVGPSTSQLVMEHEMFRHVEIELFVQRSRLPAAMKFLANALVSAGKDTIPLDPGFLAQLAETRLGNDLKLLRGRYCHHYPICVRKVLTDDTLISMACRSSRTDAGAPDQTTATEVSPDEAWYSITLTNYQRGKAREPFDQLASFLARGMAQLFAARPHWGKLCPLGVEELRQLYPAFATFQQIRERVDPQHVFSNRWTEPLLEDSRCDNTGVRF